MQQPSLQQSTGRGLPEPCPTPTNPATGARCRSPAAPRATRKCTYSPSSAQVQWGESPKANSQRRAIPVPARKGSGCWGSASRPAAPRKYARFPAPASPPLCPSLPGWAAATPRTCGGPGLALALLAGIRIHAAGRASTAARPSAERTGPAGVRTRAAASHSGRAMRGGRGQGAARQRLSPPAPRSPLPEPAGRCLLARRARGGGWGAPGERGDEGGEARVGRSRSVRRPAGSRLGLNTRGAVPLLHPRPHRAPGALDLWSRGRSCESARLSPFPWRWPSLEKS